MTVFVGAVDATFAAFGIDASDMPAGGDLVPVRSLALAKPDAEAGDTSGWTDDRHLEAGTAEGTIAALRGGSLDFSATGGTNPAILDADRRPDRSGLQRC